ncbi:type III pantothenate kinase [Luteimonas pelagia]
MSDWLFDLGNTRIKLAPLEADGTPGAMHRLDYAGLAAGQVPQGGTAWVASVASPARLDEFRAIAAQRFDAVRVVRTHARLGGLRIAYREPGRLGIDRFLALLAAHAGGGGPWLVVGVGTALTIDLLGADGRHLGGRIAPSPTLMREALHARATQLPATGGAPVAFADDTADALASGCEGAAIALVEQSRAWSVPRVGLAPRVLLHGGGAGDLAGRIGDVDWRPSLVLDGLAAMAAIEGRG